MYEVGDKVVYPHHGAGKVMKIERKEVLGQLREYLTIQILHNDMTVMVPVENADRAGLRKVVDPGVVDNVLEVLELAERKAVAETVRCKAIDDGIPVPDISRATYGEK